MSVKGILSQLKYALKSFCIDLLHFQAVFPTLENKSFIQFFKVIPCVAFLSKNVNDCAPFPSLAEPCGFVLICVCVDHNAQCAVCKVYFSAQPNNLKLILNFQKYYPIEHIFVPACSSARKEHFFKF